MVDESWNAEFLAKANQAKELMLRCNDEELKENWNRIAMAYWGISQGPSTPIFCEECGGPNPATNVAGFLFLAKKAERSVRKTNAISECQSWGKIAAEYRSLARLARRGESPG